MKIFRKVNAVAATILLVVCYTLGAFAATKAKANIFPKIGEIKKIEKAPSQPITICFG